MVAKINAVREINRAIYYNEHKVAEGLANCIYAHNFIKDATDLNLREKKSN